MSSQHLKLIAIGLAVLLLLWGGSELLSRGSDSLAGSLALPALSPDSVDTISVIKGADSIVLVNRPPAGWTVNGHRTALDAVSELLKAIGDSVHPELVAQDRSSFTRLGVDSAGGRWLRVHRRRGQPVTLIAGGRGSDFESMYLRRPGDPHVYLWRGRLPSLLDRPADAWRDKRIATLPVDSIVGIDVVRGKDRYSVARAKRRWTLNGAATDSAAQVRYLDRLKTISAAGFATPKEVDSTRAARPTRRLTVRGFHGVMLSLTFDSTATGFVVRRLAGTAAEGAEGASVYRMNSWDVDGVTPASRSLLPPKQ